MILGLASLTYAIIEGQADGWTSATILTLFAVSLARSRSSSRTSCAAPSR